MALEDAVAELEPLAFLLGRLLDQLCARLVARALAAAAIRVRFDLEAADGNELRPERTPRRQIDAHGDSPQRLLRNPSSILKQARRPNRTSTHRKSSKRF